MVDTPSISYLTLLDSIYLLHCRMFQSGLNNHIRGAICDIYWQDVINVIQFLTGKSGG